MSKVCNLIKKKAKIYFEILLEYIKFQISIEKVL